MMRFFLLVFALLLINGAKAQSEVGSIIFKGLERTKEEYLTKNLLSQVGDDYNDTLLKLDIDWLLRMNRFFEVDTVVHRESDEVDIEFIVRESSYRYPLLGIDVFSDILKLYVGGEDLNSGGTFTEVGVSYTYYDRHSFSAFVKKPYWNRNYGGKIRFSKYSTNEPLYFFDTTSIFEFDNYALTFGMHRWLRDVHQIAIESSGFREFYKQQDDVDLGLAGQRLDFWKYQVRLGYRYNDLDYFFEKINGKVFEINMETVQTKDFPQASFYKADAGFKYFYAKGISTFALQTRLGMATNNFSPFTPYVVDGFTSVRGIGNRIDRGSAQLVQNFEYRMRVLNHPWLIVQLVGFADAQKVRTPGAAQLLQDYTYFASGLGIRLLPQRWYKTVFRMDYSLITSEDRRALSFGLGHFF